MLPSTTRTTGHWKILDFDIENRPLSYLGQDFTTSEITAIAASFGPDEPMHCWLLGIHEPIAILEEFRVLFDQADMVTGHYIRNHDLPIINGSMLEYGLKPLGPKLTSDTKNDLVASKGVSRSQESISEMMALEFPKVGMSQGMWRAANRLERLDLTERRVTGDVRQHQAMRARLIEQGMLRAPRMWSANG